MDTVTEVTMTRLYAVTTRGNYGHARTLVLASDEFDAIKVFKRQVVKPALNNISVADVSGNHNGVLTIMMELGVKGRVTSWSVPYVADTDILSKQFAMYVYDCGSACGVSPGERVSKMIGSPAKYDSIFLSWRRVGKPRVYKKISVLDFKRKYLRGVEK